MEDDSLPLSRQERTATIVFGTILAGFGLFWAIAASFVPTRNTYQAITPSFLPFWTGVILCGAGQNLRLILRYLRIFWLKIQPAFKRKPLLSSPCTA